MFKRLKGEEMSPRAAVNFNYSKLYEGQGVQGSGKFTLQFNESNMENVHTLVREFK